MEMPRREDFVAAMRKHAEGRPETQALAAGGATRKNGTKETTPAAGDGGDRAPRRALATTTNTARCWARKNTSGPRRRRKTGRRKNRSSKYAWLRLTAATEKMGCCREGGQGPPMTGPGIRPANGGELTRLKEGETRCSKF